MSATRQAGPSGGTKQPARGPGTDAGERASGSAAGRSGPAMDRADSLLQRVVDAEGAVDYDALTADDLATAMAAVRDADLDRLQGSDRYAFLLNAYNLGSLVAAKRVLVDGGKRVRSLNSKQTWIRFFLFTPIPVAGRRMSLFRLEFQYLKPLLRRDGRGHFGMVCASVGCPPLRGGVFHGDELDDELDRAGHAFLRPGAGYEVDHRNNILRLNRIFKWYRSDFGRLGGLRAIFERYAADEDAQWHRDLQPRIRFLDYDWDLNAAG